MLDVVKLATLREVIARGSFSAATALSLTQPAVSRQVSLLEQRLGTQLVRRTRQGVLATEAGRLLAEHADAVLGRLARAEEEVAELAGLRAGRVRLGMFFTAFAQLSPEVQALAERRHPGLTVSYELVDRRTAFRRLRGAELDPRLVLAGHGDEPVEAQVYVAAGAGVMLAHALNVIVNAGRIAVRPLVDGPARRIEAAIAAEQRAPAARALLALLRELR
jgi:regulatory helix-turn-helix LysR family protein